MEQLLGRGDYIHVTKHDVTADVREGYQCRYDGTAVYTHLMKLHLKWGV